MSRVLPAFGRWNILEAPRLDQDVYVARHEWHRIYGRPPGCITAPSYDGGRDPLARIRPVPPPSATVRLILMAGAIRRSPLASFVVLAYVVSWAWAFPFVGAGDVVKKGVGWPTHFPALLGPALAALVVTALVWGRAGVRDLLARMARWRMPVRWWAATFSPLAFLGVALAVLWPV